MRASLVAFGLALLFEFLPGMTWLSVLTPQPRLGGAAPGGLLSRLGSAAEGGAKDEARDDVGEAELDHETVDRPELSQPEQVALPRSSRGPIATVEEQLPPIDVEEPPVPLVDPTDEMHAFYRALERTQRDRSITRILYHGDSVVASDYVTGTLRRKLQGQFGDSGHGFMLMANAWRAYFHNDVFRFSTRGWKVSRIVGPYLKDGLYGLGGVSFNGPPGIRAQFGTADKGTFGRNVGSFEIAYLAQPGGGEMLVNLDGEHHSTIDTSADAKRTRYTRIEVEDGPHRLEVVTRRRNVRAFGVVMERDEPGVVLDAIGVQGARIRFLDKQDDEHWAEQIRWRKPNLMVFQFGANESGDGFAYSMPDYHRTMKAVLLQAKAAAPDASCLILAAMDRARNSEWGLITVPIIPHIVEQQRKTALDVECAFWNTYEAMGGKGSMARWLRRGLGQADMTHPSSVGADILGTWIYRALIKDYQAFLAERRALD